MADKIKNIFVSHQHNDADKIEAVKDLIGRHGINMRDSSIYESKLKNNATNEQYTFIGLSIHECHKESLSNKIGITRLCNPLAYPASYNNHGDFLLSEVSIGVQGVQTRLKRNFRFESK